jgi:hypothetical protein
LVENKSEPDSPQRQDCEECNRLWRTYTLATRLQLEAIVAQEAALQSGDVEKIKALKEAAAEAGRSKALARKAVWDHAAMHASTKLRGPG